MELCCDATLAGTEHCEFGITPESSLVDSTNWLCCEMSPDRSQKIICDNTALWEDEISPGAFNDESWIPLDVFEEEEKNDLIEPIWCPSEEDKVLSAAITSALSGTSPLTGKMCTVSTCSHKFTSSQLSQPADSFLRHAVHRHRHAFVEAQYMRLLSGEIPNIDFCTPLKCLREVMHYISDRKLQMNRCILSGCKSFGKDRNIMMGHLRRSHRKTFNYCRLISTVYDAHEITSCIDQYFLDVENKKKRKYSCKKSPAETADAEPSAKKITSLQE
jgi:hypothetical protein